MSEDHPLSSRYAGVASLEQFLNLLKTNPGLRRPTATIARGIISKSSLYDVLNDHRCVRVDTLLRFCQAYDADVIVAVRKKQP